MTTSINTMLKNRKNRKNKKGFSLVELIVVLVIMAILAAALVPTLIGYIRQTRQSNAKNEAASAVSAAQMIASSAFANPDYKYLNNGNGTGTGDVKFTPGTSAATPDDSDKLIADIEYLAELTNITGSDNTAATGGVTSVSFDSNFVVNELHYNDGTTYVVYYKPATGAAKYGVGTTDEAATTDSGKTSG